MSRWIYTQSQLFDNEEIIKNMTLITLRYHNDVNLKNPEIAGVVLHCFNAKGNKWQIDLQHLYFLNP